MERRVIPPTQSVLIQGLVTNTLLVLQRVGGKDASKMFWKYHSPAVLKRYKGKLQVGSLDSKKAAAPATPPATPPPAPAAAKAVATTDKIGPKEALEVFGDLVPFGDPAWYQGVCCHQYPLFDPKAYKTNLFLLYSTVPLSSTKLTLLSATKCDNGLTPSSNPMFQTGMQPKRSPRESTSKWVKGVTSRVC